MFPGRLAPSSPHCQSLHTLPSLPHVTAPPCPPAACRSPPACVPGECCLAAASAVGLCHGDGGSCRRRAFVTICQNALLPPGLPFWNISVPQPWRQGSSRDGRTSRGQEVLSALHLRARLPPVSWLSFPSMVPLGTQPGVPFAIYSPPHAICPQSWQQPSQ